MTLAATMSFRRRLNFFFVLLIAIPMVAVAALLIRTSGQLGAGRTDAALEQAQATAFALYAEHRDRLRHESGELARLLTRQRAWELNRSALSDLLAGIVGNGAVRSASLIGARGQVIKTIGGSGGINAVRITLTYPVQEHDQRREAPPNRHRINAILLANVSAGDFTREVARLTRAEVAIGREEGMLASTIALTSMPQSGAQINSEDRQLQARTAELASGLNLTLLIARDSQNPLERQPILTAIFIVLLLSGGLFAKLMTRSTHRQVEAMLKAAKSVGQGDFTIEVPVSGGDELAAFAVEFNRMTNLVASQVEELDLQRQQLENSIRRLGEAMASGLNREAMLELALLMTIEACGADYGHLLPRGEGGAGELEVEDRDAADVEEALRGPTSHSHDILDDEGRALIGELEGRAGAGAIAHEEAGPWAGMAKLLSSGESEAVMALARRGRGFNETEREIFAYLTSQVGVSLENLTLYRRLAEQATTDELTSLANRRRFNEVLEAEVERANRFGHPLALLMADIDDFKPVNDSEGHSAGDRALTFVGRVLREETRSVDEPARYGGEEFTVLLPETDLAGALDVAERVRARIEAESADPYVTASFGVAMLAGAGDGQTLVDRADAALYRAKGAGKNRVEADDQLPGKTPPGPRARD